VAPPFDLRGSPARRQPAILAKVGIERATERRAPDESRADWRKPLALGMRATLECADCHTPILTTGSNAIAALARKEVRLYSDLLLHDMGALGDGIVQGSASGTQMKTPPLWGVRVSAPYLHDGRAATLDAAILAHAGEGAPSRNRYAALSTDQRTRLLSFLGTL
jgi:CxxC motif-containing protein (DUF1111 family)